MLKVFCDRSIDYWVIDIGIVNDVFGEESDDSFYIFVYPVKQIWEVRKSFVVDIDVPV